MQNSEGPQFTPEAEQFLRQMSIHEQRRIGIVAEAIRLFAFPDGEQMEVFLGGRPSRDGGKLTHHLSLSIGVSEISAKPLFSHLVESLQRAQLPFEAPKSSLEIGQPHFLTEYSRTLSLTGKPLHITVGKIDPINGDEIRVRLI